MLLALGLTYLSCLAFSLSIKRHFQQLFPSKKISSRQLFSKELSAQKIFILRILGWLLLILSSIVCAQLYGIATGLVLLCGLFSAAAFVIALLLHYSPQMTIALALIQLLLGVAWMLY
jgi:hypothetical protein